MADITASVALRDFIAGRLTTAGGCYMWATLHSALTGLSASSVYAASGISELPTANGYTAGGKTCGTISVTNGVLDTPDVVWTTGAGQTLTAAACCLWINSTNNIMGASLVCCKDSAQTASNGGTITVGISNPITIPTPA
jgi:hypothetical protein